MKLLSPAAAAALAARNITLRDFVWIEARDRITGEIVPAGYWSDLGTIMAQVIDPRTGSPVSRSFKGAGGLIDVSQIPMVSNLSVQTVTITASQISDPNNLARVYNLKQARVEIFRGLFTPAALVQLAPAYSRFVGFVDSVNITTPAEGGEGRIELTCVSHSQEMGRRNTASRSDADARNRQIADSFNRHTAAVGTWEIVWGKATSNTGGTPAPAPAPPRTVTGYEKEGGR